MAAKAQGFCLFATAIGACGIAWNSKALAGVQLPEADVDSTRRRMARTFAHASEAQEDNAPAHARHAMERIRALLQGNADPLLDIELDMTGVPEFNQRVYQVTRAIPPGRTLTYGEVAWRIDEPGAARAVGQALGNNPFAPVVPCHRVLAARSAAGGFSAAGGIATKLRMLQIEKAQLGPEPGLFD